MINSTQAFLTMDQHFLFTIPYLIGFVLYLHLVSLTKRGHIQTALCINTHFHLLISDDCLCCFKGASLQPGGEVDADSFHSQKCGFNQRPSTVEGPAWRACVRACDQLCESWRAELYPNSTPPHLHSTPTSPQVTALGQCHRHGDGGSVCVIA